MSHKCLGGCNKWIGEDRLFCIACEKVYARNGSGKNGQESSGSPDDSGDETSEE